MPDRNRIVERIPTTEPRFWRNPRLGYAALGIGVAVGAVAMLAYNVLSVLSPGVADPANPRQVELGRAVYANACALCHGKNLEGQSNWQSRSPTGELPAPPHDKDGHTWHHPDQVLFRITKFGGRAEAPAGYKSNMPGFGGTLSDAEILAVLAYIKSRWPVPVRSRQAEIDRRNSGG